MLLNFLTKLRDEQSQAIIHYHQDHQADFTKFCNNRSYIYITDKFYILSGIIVFAAIANASLAGVESFLFFLPPFLLSITPWVLSFRKKIKFIPYINYYINFIGSLAILMGALLYEYIYRIGAAPAELPPIQILLLVFIGLTTFNDKFHTIIVINLLHVISIVTLYWIIHPNYVLEGVHQYIGGFAVGTFLNLLNAHHVRTLFYIEGQHIKLQKTHISTIEKQRDELVISDRIKSEFIFLNFRKINNIDVIDDTTSFVGRIKKSKFNVKTDKMLEAYAIDSSGTRTEFYGSLAVLQFVFKDILERAQRDYLINPKRVLEIGYDQKKRKRKLQSIYAIVIGEKKEKKKIMIAEKYLYTILEKLPRVPKAQLGRILS